ncbi:diguanylate cyclase domain-containing protein [Alkalimonas amylolytica]|uniref:diguanylate cyclase n=1 Tax=Alkalimonas amylolytica TaxID=152573 RepID=A0A1H4EXT2_ALKAM|nr:diguanylate cyclase [Alkalimonas amylolytica]SEA89657.1 diguanylate cyclase (GGDEF) domain-containing protein [Alkalimonas amylolytica]
MKTILLLFAVVVSLLPLSVSSTVDDGLQFTDFEKKVWSKVMSYQTNRPEDIYDALLPLKDEARSQKQLELVSMHLCRLWAIQHLHVPGSGTSTGDYEFSELSSAAAAYYRCQQAKQVSLNQLHQASELSHLAYHSLSDHDLPALRIWIAYDYIETATEAGAFDDAIMAAQLSIQIAKANDLTEWEGETLARLALIQSALGNFEQALSTNSEAMQLIKQPDNLFETRANRAYIMMTANRLTEAKEIYRALLNQHKGIDDFKYLIAGINLTGIYYSLGMNDENRKLTNELLELATHYPGSYVLAYTKVAMANTLLQQGDKEAAESMFLEARLWFEQNQVLEPLSRFLSDWANNLYRSGFYLEAFTALRDSMKLTQDIDATRQKENATLTNALITAEQQKRELLLYEQQQQQREAKLVQKQLELRLTLSILTAAFLLIFSIVIAYKRVQKTNQLLSEKNEHLDYASNHDPLTNVYNRRYFEKFLLTKENSEAKALVLLIDIDHFKKVNDVYGHKAGDEVLIIVSKRLASRLRNTECIVRWGGEEFLIFINKPDQKEQCIQIIQRVLSEINAYPIYVGKQAISVTISLGFMVVTIEKIADFEKSLKEIDSFLYQAKQQGRNRAIGCLDEQREVLVIKSNAAHP